MIAVIFETWPADGRGQDYLDTAALLYPLLCKVPGFISVERFQSLSDPDKILSLSFFTDETTIAHWRSLTAHRAGQAQGRAGIFRDYRIRVAAVVRDYGLRDRDQAPADSIAAHGGARPLSD